MKGDRAPVPRSLTRLAGLYGVQSRYKDTTGQWHTPDAEVLKAALRAMGARIGPDGSPEALIRAREEALGRRMLDPTTPVWLPGRDAASASMELRLPESWHGAVELRLVTEQGLVHEWSETPRLRDSRTGTDARSGGAIGAPERSGTGGGTGGAAESRIGEIALPPDLPTGYHELAVRAGRRTARTLLLAAPPRTFRPERDPPATETSPSRDAPGGTRAGTAGAPGATSTDGPRDWGLFLPLYALRSEGDWGTGSFPDLLRLMRWTGERGGSCVGTLPLLAGAEKRPRDARVYSPFSRLFWNEVYLDVEGAPGLAESAAARQVLESAAFEEEIRRLRNTDLVDWQGAVEAKRKVLEPLADDFLSNAMPDAVRAFLDERPDVEEYARFRACHDARGEPWHRWPEHAPPAPGGAGPSGTDADLAADPGDGAGTDDRFRRFYRYHLYVQWLAHRQLEALRDGGGGGDGRSNGGSTVGLYLDLPVGCDPDGYDVWKHRDLFARDVSVGAPPDDFFSGGQDWGFPPPLPDVMEETGFAYTRAALRHHMAHASRLRLDHVMGLHRLFWIPDGASARTGVYVRYPDEALYALLCIESHRTRTVVVGENLGTVPREVQRSMARRGLDGMFVAQFEFPPDPEKDPPRPAHRSLASVNTHDTPTFAGFWRARDVDIRQETGLVSPREAEEERKERQRTCDRWARFLEKRGLKGPARGDPTDPRRPEDDEVPAVLRGTLRYLARSRSSLLLVNLEDLWLEEQPQNVPGSGSERPNFCLKARYQLEEFVRMESVRGILDEIDELRRTAPGSEAEPGFGTGSPAPASNPESPRIAMATSTSDTETDPPTGTGAETETASPVRSDFSLLDDDDLHLFNEGSHFRLYRKLGARLMEHGGERGVHFAVWAPNARDVHLAGDFNQWDKTSHPLSHRGSSGIWEGFVPGLEKGTRYKYHIRSRVGDHRVDKADPFGVHHETPPRTASVVWDLDYEWGDAEWMEERAPTLAHDAPISIYELHIGSWKRGGTESGEHPEGRPLTYRELAPELIRHLDETGFTHVEFLPVMEHPFYGSWGYQTTGYFAPTSRYGTPQDFMFLVDRLHQAGYGVILDWVPSHFPNDEHGLAFFDGTHLFEHQDPREGFHPDWKSHIFNFGRHEVRSFLISSALFWLEHFHIDGIRVDAVASMLYRDYGRDEGEWIPNEHGGRENLEAIGFLRRLNEEVYRSHPDVQTMAEESTAWPMVSRPTYLGGLGFGMKWDMGWMHDTLQYMSKDPVHRRFHHDDLTFRRVYAFSENFVLPLSHDEVVHGKGSLIGKMPGDAWRQFANLRLLLTYQATQPGKKLLFMGCEFGQRREWNHDRSLDWHLVEQHDSHRGVQRLVGDLNRIYRSEPALHEWDFDERGFDWIDASDGDQSVLSFARKGEDPADFVAVVFNFTPVPRENYRIGVPRGGEWREIINSDAEAYGGSGRGNLGGVEATPVPYHGQTHSLVLSLPPLAALVLKAPPPERTSPRR